MDPAKNKQQGTQSKRGGGADRGRHGIILVIWLWEQSDDLQWYWCKQVAGLRSLRHTIHACERARRCIRVHLIDRSDVSAQLRYRARTTNSFWRIGYQLDAPIDQWGILRPEGSSNRTSIRSVRISRVRCCDSHDTFQWWCSVSWRPL